MAVNLFNARSICLLLASGLIFLICSTKLANEFLLGADHLFLREQLLFLPILFLVLFTPLLGINAQKCTRKKQLIVSILVFAIVGAISSLALFFDHTYVSQVALGVSATGLMMEIIALIADRFLTKKHLDSLKIQPTFASIGGVIFMFIAGYLASINLILTFYIYAIAILALPFIFLALQARKHLR